MIGSANDNNVTRPTNNFPRNAQPLNNGIYKSSYKNIQL